MSDEVEPNYCKDFDHDWEKEYYGIRCKVCGLFYPEGQGPWVMPVDGLDEPAGDYEPEFIGVEIEPGFVAHVKPDVQPETIEALKELRKKLIEAAERGEL